MLSPSSAASSRSGHVTIFLAKIRDFPFVAMSVHNISQGREHAQACCSPGNLGCPFCMRAPLHTVCAAAHWYDTGEACEVGAVVLHRRRML